VDINGEQFDVQISYDEDNGQKNITQTSESKPETSSATVHANGDKEILAPIEGNFMLTKNSTETPLQIGAIVQEGDLIGYIEAMKVYNAIRADKSGKVIEICQTNGNHVDEDDLLLKLS
jgi:pyruvate carboxylase subunit B